MKANIKWNSQAYEIEDSLEAVNEFVLEKRWGDGLPVIPPTEERVSAMLREVNRAPEEVVGKIPPCDGEATIEKIAINAVMAGCLPSYMPVLIAAAEAMADPILNLLGVQATTNPVAVMCILNGPLRKKLDINCGRGCLGPGWRANATIGRAIRLMLINIGGGLPGSVDKAVHGMPGKYTFCFGEDEEASPWDPLHVERGFEKGVSTVTLTSVASTVNSLTTSIANAETFLKVAAPAMATPCNNNILSGGGEQLLVMTSGHAKALSRGGFSKQDCRKYLYEHAVVALSALGDAWYPGKTMEQLQLRDGMLRPVKRAEDILIIVAGGEESYHHVVMHTFGDDSWSVTKRIAE